MVRKITPTSGGWRKSFGSAEQQRAFEQSATRTLLAFSPTAAAWRDRTIHSLSALLTRRLHAPALLAAFRKFAEALVECEMPVLPEPATSSREPVEAVEHRRELRAMLSYTSHADQLFKEWIDAIAHLLGRIVDHIPEHATGPATSLLSVPLIEVLARPLDLVQHIVESLLRFARDETFPVRPGAVLAGRVQHALLRISKLTDEAACRNPHRLVPPTDSGLTGTELIATYLGNTPFSTLLTTPVPFTIPREFFCEHAVLIAGSGMGKTQCFQCIGLDLFRQPDPPAMFIVDSQDDEKGILHKIAHLDIFHPEHGRLRDRLLISLPT